MPWIIIAWLHAVVLTATATVASASTVDRIIESWMRRVLVIAVSNFQRGGDRRGVVEE
ncbi:MAG TPA: hypothetical protein VF147_02825 [Vicinamibacterales bacterium]